MDVSNDLVEMGEN